MPKKCSFSQESKVKKDKHNSLTKDSKLGKHFLASAIIILIHRQSPFISHSTYSDCLWNSPILSTRRSIPIPIPVLHSSLTCYFCCLWNSPTPSASIWDRKLVGKLPVLLHADLSFKLFGQNIWKLVFLWLRTTWGWWCPGRGTSSPPPPCPPPQASPNSPDCLLSRLLYLCRSTTRIDLQYKLVCISNY